MTLAAPRGSHKHLFDRCEIVIRCVDPLCDSRGSTNKLVPETTKEPKETVDFSSSRAACYTDMQS